MPVKYAIDLEVGEGVDEAEVNEALGKMQELLPEGMSFSAYSLEHGQTYLIQAPPAEDATDA